MERLLTVKDVAERLGVTRWTVRRWLRAGLLRADKLPRAWRISEEQLQRFLEAGGNAEERDNGA